MATTNRSLPEWPAVVTRRRLIELFGGGYLGLSLGGLWRAQAATKSVAVRTPIRACILVFYYGGPSHLDTYDMKPGAPDSVRGEFKPIATAAPGIQICEHLPHMARVMDKVALVRSVHHAARLHDSASIHALTGRPLDGTDRELFAPLPQVFPSFGSGVARGLSSPPDPRGGQGGSDVPFASLPYSFHNVVDVPCQGAGILGADFDPVRLEVDPSGRKYRMEAFEPAVGVDRLRSDARRTLLSRIEPADQANASWRHLRTKVYHLLDSTALRQALDISHEPATVRERYGFGAESVAVGEGGGGGNGAELGYSRHMRGQNLLLARRLVEAGVSFVNVYDFKQQGQNWDAHFKCANQHKTHLLPQADRALSALIEDLDDRGLLDSTLVVAMGEFGRTPQINGGAGRDHWPDCYTVLLAGGGVQGGAVYGSSDRIGAFPATNPVTPGDLAATIFWRFGLDPESEIHDRTNRPYKLADGQPLERLF